MKLSPLGKGEQPINLTPSSRLSVARYMRAPCFSIFWRGSHFDADESHFARRQSYSIYLPVNAKHASKSHRKSSTSKEAETKAKDKSKVSRAEALASRRLTMNSRSAYDDEEVLKRVLEESKNDGVVAAGEGAARKAKRGREDGDE
jgi:hypothetical protein